MLSRRVMFPLAMAGAVGGPLTYFNTGDLAKQVSSLATGSTTQSPFEDHERYAQAAAAIDTPSATNAPLDLVPLEEALRFQITPQWVLGRWSRVSTQLAELDMQGYRVSLITGTTPADVAGSLTYYFDREGQLQRITFRGTTGDPARLAAIVTQYFGLQAAVSDQPGEILFQESWGGKTSSELRLTPAAIVRNDHPQSRYHVELRLARPRAMG